MRGAEMLADAVALGARGYYDESWRLLDLVDQPSLNSLVSSTRGSHLRQIGAIDLARKVDGRALADAMDAESRADARIGLAADEVAEHRLGGDQLAAARDDAMHDWRTATRWWWVSAESALLVGELEGAEGAARTALVTSEPRSARHAAKSRIMVGAVVAARGEQPDEHLLAAEQTLVRDALATLQWPLALVVIAAMQHGVAGPALRDRAPSLVDAGRAAVGFIAAHLPADLAGRFLARTDLGPLLDAGSADVAGTFDVPR